MRRSCRLLAIIAFVAPLNAALANGQPLICFGNEPFWGLDLSDAATGRFSTPDSPEVAYLGAFDPPAHPSKSVWRGRAGAPEGGDLVAVLREGACSDGMSDTSHPFSVEVTLPYGRRLTGCCRLPIDGGHVEPGAWELASGPGFLAIA
ncbi:hypothetical protein F2Q65_08805 [Thiohalocapsa marina]|uniref:Uncharacterized protein n=1 Tax=Thiohalocapsa marina TaxID=424902 RepID=A0A5M8FKD8_9GAMM|nr:hypothetical protein [Thiohalocapsa marina]KAA6185368.1 hypothetical protein F2Q65_08805 [Thiohalocapsa marina]